MAYMRFSVPDYDYEQFNGLSWAPPDLLSASDAEKQIQAGGCIGVSAADEVFDKLNVRGDQRHAVMCAIPRDGHLQGQSWAWWKQRAIIIDSLDATSMNIVQDWRTPRAMNTRLGPDDGVAIAAGTYFVISSHRYDDHWIGNRTILQNDLENGFRILATSKDDADTFGECCLSFTWAD